MRSLFAGITTRGRAFFAAGIAVGGFGLSLGQRELMSLGGVLVFLPLLSALAAGRARYRVRCLRQIAPARVPAGEAATVTIQLDNVTRLPTGLLLAEDTIPYSLGTRPRFVLDRIEAGGSRRITYRLQSDRRGKYDIGPLNVRVADAFGLVRLGRQVALPGTLVVTPVITQLPWTAFGGTWLKADGSRASTAAAAGALAFHCPLRRAHGAPGGAAVAEPCGPVPGYPGRGTRRPWAVIVLRVRGQRRRLDRHAPGPGGHQRRFRHRHRAGERRRHVRGCAA